MIYSWKVNGLFKVDAQTAGSELQRLYQRDGAITPQAVVDESRPENAPLHGCFEWRDDVAAEEYRKQQARVMIAQITVVRETVEQKPITIRAFVNTTEDYQPINVVLTRPDLNEQMLQNALRELASFRKKYNALKQLKPVMEAIDDTLSAKSGKVAGKRKSTKAAAEVRTAV